MRSFALSAAALAVLLLFTGRPSHAENFDHAGLAREFLNDHLRPGYARLGNDLSALGHEAETFCEGPIKAGLEALRDAFRGAALAWSAVSHIRFGPVMDEHRHARMLYWPDRKSLGFRQVRRAIRTRDKSVVTEKDLAEKSVALQGLSAIEQLLFWKAETGLIEQGDDQLHRCGYLKAATENLASIAKKLNEEWAPGSAYAEVFLNPGSHNPRYLVPSEVTLEIAKTFIVGLERLRDVKVAGSLGMRQNSRARLRLPFEPSGVSTRAIQAELEGLVSMFEDGGLRQRIEAHESGMGKTIAFDLEQAFNSLSRIEQPIAKAVENPAIEDELIATGFPLKNAREEASRVLAEAAGLSLGFNALDGD